MDIKLIPQEIEYRAFQFALFKRKVIITENEFIFNTKRILAKDITSVRYARINKVAGNRIAKSDYKVELKSKDNKKIKVSFSHVVSQGHPEKIEKVYFDIINVLTPVFQNILNANLAVINSGGVLTFENITINKNGVEIKPELFRKGSQIPWQNLVVNYGNGSLDFLNNGEKITSLFFNQTWNLKILEDICSIMTNKGHRV